MLQVENPYKRIFDSHSHYDDPRFDEDRDELLSSMLSDGTVEYILHAGTNLESGTFGIEYAKRFPQFYTSVGFHPESIDEVPDGYIEKLGELISKSQKVVAIGEIGLDYHYDGYDRERQLSLFEDQLILANSHRLPVIVHSREATADTLELLKKHRPQGVVHCFSGSYETAQEIISLGMYIGFTGVLTFKNAKKALHALEAVPLDRLLLETDCPYMAPDGYRGKRCDSRMIYRIAQVASEHYRITPQELIDRTNENARRLFSIG